MIMGEVNRSWRLDRGRIRLDDLVYIYPQWSPAPPCPVKVGASLQSYGIAPSAPISREAAPTLSDAALVAVAEGEVIWLGFQSVASSRPILVRVRADELQHVDALTGECWTDLSSNRLVCPPDFRLLGVWNGE